MSKVDVKELNEMIDEYVIQKTDVEKVRTMIQEKTIQMDTFSRLIDRYSSIAIYRGVVNDLVSEFQSVKKEVEQLTEELSKLEARDKGFEGRRVDVIEDVLESHFGMN